MIYQFCMGPALKPFELRKAFHRYNKNRWSIADGRGANLMFLPYGYISLWSRRRRWNSCMHWWIFSSSTRKPPYHWTWALFYAAARGKRDEKWRGLQRKSQPARHLYRLHSKRVVKSLLRSASENNRQRFFLPPPAPAKIEAISPLWLWRYGKYQIRHIANRNQKTVFLSGQWIGYVDGEKTNIKK